MAGSRPGTPVTLALSQSLIPGALRFVLTWDSRRDLDLSVSFDTSEDKCTVAYYNPNCASGRLDRDNRDGPARPVRLVVFSIVCVLCARAGGLGPETITVSPVTQTIYTVIVSQYAPTSTNLEGAAATVEVSESLSCLRLSRHPAARAGPGPHLRMRTLCLTFRCTRRTARLV